MYRMISHHYHNSSHHHHHDPPPPQQGAAKSRQELDRRQWILQVDARLPHDKQHIFRLPLTAPSPSLAFVPADLHSPLSAYLCPLSPASRNFSCRDPRLAHKVMQSIYNPIPHLFYNRKPPMFDIPSIGLRVLMQRRAGFVISRGSKRSSAMISGGIHHRRRRIVFLSLGVLRNSVLTLHIK